MNETRLDLRGLKCPMPVLRTQKAMKGAAIGTVLAVETTDPLAALDLENLAREDGHVYLGRLDNASYQTHRLQKVAPT